MRISLLFLLMIGCVDVPAAREGRPSVVFILADDLGYGDLACYGAPDVRSPNVDALARQGVRLTQFYSNGASCTPTRTGFLTGRYPQRVGGLECAIGNGNVGRYDDAVRLCAMGELGLPPSESELPRALKGAGYACAVTGKWHLGYPRKFLPDRHGFDTSFGPLGGGTDYFFHTEPDGRSMLYRNGEPAREEGYLTDLITREAVGFIRRQGPRPFFLYVPYTSPHAPYQGPNDRRDRPLTDGEWDRGTRPTFAAMVERMDQGVGEILRALEERGLAANTLVVFTSDNGGDPRGRNDPYRGRKGSVFEGGIRVPCIVRWPGMLRAGTESDRVGITMDLTASILRAAGARPGRPLDGVDLVAELRDGRPQPPRTLFWRSRRGESTWRAAREGPIKYVSRQNGPKFEEHLFDVAADPSETTPLAAGHPARERLKALLAAWEREVAPAR